MLWNDLELVVQPRSGDGLLVFNGDDDGDFIALYLHNGFAEFAFDAGDAVTTVRYSSKPQPYFLWRDFHAAVVKIREDVICYST